MRGPLGKLSIASPGNTCPILVAQHKKQELIKSTRKGLKWPEVLHLRWRRMPPSATIWKRPLWSKQPYFIHVFKASPAVLHSWLQVHLQALLSSKVCPVFPFKDSPSTLPSHCICSHKNMLKRFFSLVSFLIFMTSKGSAFQCFFPSRYSWNGCGIIWYRVCN